MLCKELQFLWSAHLPWLQSKAGVGVWIKGILRKPKARFWYPHWSITFMWNQLLWCLKRHQPPESPHFTVLSGKEMPCSRSNGKSVARQGTEPSARHQTSGSFSFGYWSTDSLIHLSGSFKWTVYNKWKHSRERTKGWVKSLYYSLQNYNP